MAFHEPTAPPAHVREADSLLDMARTINNALSQGVRASQAGIDSFREAGEKLLKAKEKIGHGGWLAWVQKHVQCTDREARRYMRLAKEWSRLKSDTVSDLTINQAMRLLSEDAPEEDDAKPDTGKTDGPILCKRCLRLFPGVGREGCMDCKAMRTGAAAKKRKATQTEREPGDDTESEEAEKEKASSNGQVVWNRKVFNEDLGKAIRELNKLAHQYGAVDARGVPSAPEYQAIRGKLTEAEKEAAAWASKLKKGQTA